MSGRAWIVGGLALLVSASVARAQGAGAAADEGRPPLPPLTGTPPPDVSRREVVDLTFGMRDDIYTTVAVGNDGTLWAGTLEGRIYRSRDRGVTWDEAVVVPQRRLLFGFRGQEILYGSLRSQNTVRADLGIDLAPGIGPPLDGRNSALLGGDVSGALAPRGDLALEGPSDYTSGGGMGQLFGPTMLASGFADSVLGFGLSSRAPRLSLALQARGRILPVYNFARLLINSGSRPSEIRGITQHPTDPRVVFAATRYGLYRSQDGGVSWLPVFMGATALERATYWVTIDPTDPRRMFLGTERGMFVSVDGGSSWVKNGALPDVMAQHIAIDPRDPRYVYVAAIGGLFRSDDGGRTFVLAFYSTQARHNDIWWVTIDPFDPEHGYVGTSDGALETHKLRSSRAGDYARLKPPLTEGRTTAIMACREHRGHVYMYNAADLWTINYGANGPEALVSESWDGGQRWRVLFGNLTQGNLSLIAPDSVDPDVLYIAASRALARIDPLAHDAPVAPAGSATLDFAGPSMSQILAAAYDHNDIGPGEYQERLDLLRSRNWVPSQITLTVRAGRYRTGRVVDDQQFADDRYLSSSDDSELRIMAWASWRLPDMVYNHEAIAMQGLRVQMMNDEVRFKVLHSVHRNYGEIQRLRARIRAGGARDLYTRAVERTRLEELEAIVDHTTGGFLTKQREAAQRVAAEKP